ncbi:MAG: cobaltochelatase subunit CobN [Sneathiellales bacterium]|nr:cobaltochelatase subunit CobN [Sneathiellales bacterium]
MHIVFRESHSLEETNIAQDLGQEPADLVVLSFSDSDLGAFAKAWHGSKEKLPTLRLANLSALRHPLSVDVYLENTLEQAKAILVRLIGGEQYWQYGINAVYELARRKNIPLAVLPADGRKDERLNALSTIDIESLEFLKEMCDQGGESAAKQVLRFMAGFDQSAPAFEKKPALLDEHGFYCPEQGPISHASSPFPEESKGVILVCFYRSYITSADLEPVDRLIRKFRAAGYSSYGLFVGSLKNKKTVNWLEKQLPELDPKAIVNMTAFSARADDGALPFDSISAPVFQIALSSAEQKKWEKSSKGLAPADLAMFVAMPEIDGRIFAGLSSFKEAAPWDEDLQFTRLRHAANENSIERTVKRVLGWLDLAQKPAQDRKIAIIVSSYPGKGYQMAHAVGLDTIASLETLLIHLKKEGYQVKPQNSLAEALKNGTLSLSLNDYKKHLEELPSSLRQDLAEAWGVPETDSLYQNDGFQFSAIENGNALLAIQPERGQRTSREDEYHDLSRVPRHSYAAFYLWLQDQVDAIIHIGAHGTLEWLPGKSVALSEQCWPEVLTGKLPVIYPFIVNDPGEAVQAKRRIGAVTLGHLPPEMKKSDLPEGMMRLERLLDEFSTADGLDPNRRDRLVEAIRIEAQMLNIEKELGIEEGHSAAEALVRIDRFVCDIKESQYGDGLHVFGTGPCARQELDGVLKALDGKCVAAGPSGSPFRGNQDILPTGRNLYSTDPRAVPSRAAYAQGVKLAEELVRRHLQDHGDYPKSLVVDLWGSATMRTAGEEFAMALHLAGVQPSWASDSDRVTGFEILPLMLLERPRIEVTLRVSGLFRDIFSSLSSLFNAAARALAEREEEQDQNPYLNNIPRVLSPKPGHYGVQMETKPSEFSASEREKAAQSWLENSQWITGQTGDDPEFQKIDRKILEDIVKKADAFVHSQDLVETDILLAADYAAHEAGFAAAHQHLTGQNTDQKKPALYHIDNTVPSRPVARTLQEEVARVVRSRASQYGWLEGMLKHGFRGGAEIAATLDHMAAFSHLANVVPSHLFDLYFEKTIGDQRIVQFLKQENPEAFDAMIDCFQKLIDAGLWVTKSNSIAAKMAEAVND